MNLLLASTGPGLGSARLLKGPLRTMPGGYLGDDTGYRRILLGSDFPYFSLWERNNAEARRGKLALLKYGFQGSRDFILIANDADVPTAPTNPDGSPSYWYGSDVTKDHFRRNGVEAMQFSGELGLRTVLTFGNSPKSLDAEADWCDEWTQIVAAGECQRYVAWIEVLGNEVDVNRRRDLAFDVDVAMAHAARLQAIIRRNLPGVLLTNGSFGNESTEVDPKYPHDATLLTSAKGADGLDIHNWRGVDQVHHSHTMWYETHFHGVDRRFLAEGETGCENIPYPTFQYGGDVSTPTNDAHLVHTTISMQQYTGQPTVYLNGPGVRRRYPIDSTTYFPKIAKSVEVLPEDIPTWQDDRNPSWFNRGRQFFYVGLRAWTDKYTGTPQYTRPPRPVGTWQCYDIDGLVAEGDGTPNPPARWLGGIIKGEYV